MATLMSWAAGSAGQRRPRPRQNEPDQQDAMTESADDPADDVTSGLREGGDGDSVAFPSAVLLFAGRETSTLCRPRYRAHARQPVPSPGDAFRHPLTRRPIVPAAPALSVTI